MDAYSELQRGALCVMQALLGVVSDNFRLVSIHRLDSAFRVRIILSEHSEDDINEIKDFESELEGLLPHLTEFDTEIIVSQDPIILDKPSVSAIVVYMKRQD